MTLAGLEVLSSFVVPPWPARELRPIDATNLPSFDILASSQTQPHYNSWGENDRERSVQKPAGTEFRTVMVGDSFLEGAFVTKPIGARVEDLLQAEGHRDMEVVNLGISATARRNTTTASATSPCRCSLTPSSWSSSRATTSCATACRGRTFRR